jgi:hypothetical protein
MSNTIGYDLEGFANSSVTKSVTTSLSADIDLYLPFDSDLNDDSTNSHTVTNSGSVAVSTSVKKYGAGSADIPAAADYLEISGGQFDFGSNDFTIEGWFYDDGSGGSRNVALDYRLSGGGAAGAGNETFGFFFYLNEGGNGKFFIGLEDGSGNSAADLGYWPMFSSSSLAISTNTWTHYAITREGSTFRAFKDGSLIATQTGVSAPQASSGGSAILRIGSGHDSSGSVGMAGYIDDLRIINGTALYTEAFTPPTSAVGLTGEVTNTIVDQKFLSSVWDSDDVSEKMSDGTWIRNDVTSGANPAGVVVQGAGLEVYGHRHFTGPALNPGTPLTITAYGAGGGDSDEFTTDGGAGGYAQLTTSFPDTDTLYVVVGQAGNRPGPSVAPGGRTYGGGGGSRATSGTHPHQAPGGGFSGVFTSPYSENGSPADTSPTMPSDDVIIIAGGGGGAAKGNGGAGGGATGQDGQGSLAPYNGGGGTQNAGGSAGENDAPTPTTAGVFLTGGRSSVGEAGGGGGGGYYGGGGGGYAPAPGEYGSQHIGAGGGGSGYVGGATGVPVIDTTNTQGGGSAAEVNGQVTIRNNDTEVTTTFNYTGSQQTYSV